VIVIDKQGIVQRIHVGFDPNLAVTLKHELDSLLAGELLPQDHEVAARLYDAIANGCNPVFRTFLLA
jgi:hypothetical protein